MTSILRMPPVVTVRRSGATLPASRREGPAVADATGSLEAIDALEPLSPTVPIHPPMQAPAFDLGAFPSAPTPFVAPQSAGASPAALDEALRAAHEEGHRRGLAEGRAQGLEQGREEGRAEGRAQGREEGRKEGREEGLAEGRRDAASQADVQRAEDRRRLDDVVETIVQATRRFDESNEDDAVEAIYAVVVQVLADAHGSVDGLRAMYLAALSQVRDRRALTVHLHPADLERLRGDAARPATDAETIDEAAQPDATLAAASSPLVGSAAGSSHVSPGGPITFAADETLVAGGCRISGAGGELDARLDRHLTGLRDRLLQVRARAREESAP